MERRVSGLIGGRYARRARDRSRRRAGHSVVVLLKMYTHCIDGQADAANKRIADALGGGENGPDEQG